MLPVGWESNLELFEDGRKMRRENWKGDLNHPNVYIHDADLICFVPSAGVSLTSSPPVYSFQARYFLRTRCQAALSLLFLLAEVGLGLAGYRGEEKSERPAPPHKSPWLDSSLVVLPAASLGPLLSFLSRNTFYYSLGEMFLSIVIVGGGAFILALFFLPFCSFLRFIGRVISERGASGFAGLSRLFPELFMAAVAGVLFVLFSGLLSGNGVFPSLPRATFSLFCFTFSVSLALAIVLRWRLRGVNTLLLSFLCVASLTFLFNLIGKVQTKQVAFPLDGGREIAWTAKPDIYLFFLESYTGAEAMRDIYGVDAAPFYQQLEKRGFFVRDTYSNQNYTVASAATLMAMRHFDFGKFGSGLLDAKTEVRDMITGRKYNPVFDVLKRNGYRIAFLHCSHYLLSRPSAAIDRTNLLFRGIRSQHWPFLDAMGLKTSFADENEISPTFLEESKPLILQSLGYPTFYFIHTGLIHAPYTFNDTLAHAGWKSTYKKLREDYNVKLLDMLDFIEKNDPGSLIILIGDHGAKFFGPSLGVNSPDYPAFVASGQGTAETLARDKASVLFAIKSPVKSDIWVTRRVSHVNLFRYVFAMLSGDETLLEHPEPDVSLSWDGKFIIARDGQPLKEWEPVSPEFFQSPVSE